MLLYQFKFTLAGYEIYSFSVYLSALGIFCVFCFSHSGGHLVESHCGFNLCVCVINDIYFSMCLLAIRICSFIKCSFSTKLSIILNHRILTYSEVFCWILFSLFDIPVVYM